MNLSELITLYTKERDYEKYVFGDYNKVESLSFPSFLIFLREYCNKALTAYSGKWETTFPDWFVTCKEVKQDGSAPVKAYEEVIKIMALAGAALETYANINPDKWRQDLETGINKWKK